MKKSSKSFKAILFIGATASVLAACQSSRQSMVQGPAARWVVSSETEREPEETPSTEAFKAELGPQVERLVDLQSRSLENLDAPESREPVSSPGHWHLDAMITELGVSVSGFIGFLTTKGTPSFQLIWRRIARPSDASAPVALALSAEPTTLIDSDESDTQLERKISPAVNAMLREDPSLDGHGLRDSLIGTAREFRRIAAALEHTGDATWTPSRLRLDFSIDATGKVNPVVSVGGEARLRLEWNRNPAKPHPAQTATASQPQLSGWAKGLPEFASMLVEDLQQVEAGGEKLEHGGFWANQYRVGLGISKKGNIGIAKSTVTLIGHLYFSRKSPPTSTPVPHPLASRLSEDAAYSLVSAPGSSQLARQLRSDGMVLDETDADWTVRIDRKAFRKGLLKSMRMAGSFAELASGHDASKWQLKEIKTGFELALGGKTALTKINVLGATEIAFKAR